LKLETEDFLKDILRWKKMFLYEKKTLERSKKTLEQYERIIESFYNFSTEHEDYMTLSSISKNYILNFLMWKEENTEHFSSSSKHSYIVVLKSFLKYISDNNIQEINILNKIKDIKVKVSKREVEGFTNDENEMLILALEEMSKNISENDTTSYCFINYRNILIAKIILNGGLRASELLTLKFSNIEYLAKDNIYKILIKGKGNKERYSYIEENIIKKEMEYFKKTDRIYIAETKKGEIMERKNLYTTLSNIYKKAGINKKGIHILRHTFAQKLVEKNVNLSTIQDLLGHSNIQTTMIYARTNEKNKIEAIKKAID